LKTDSKMSIQNEELDRHIQLQRIGTRHWSWYVSVPGKGYKNCEEYAPTRDVAMEEARAEVRHLLESRGAE